MSLINKQLKENETLADSSLIYPWRSYTRCLWKLFEIWWPIVYFFIYFWPDNIL